MSKFEIGAVVGLFIGIMAALLSSAHATFTLTVLKSEVASRGYMVECVGKTGYYWGGECDE